VKQGNWCLRGTVGRSRKIFLNNYRRFTMTGIMNAGISYLIDTLNVSEVVYGKQTHNYYNGKR
jgi:hypothetical protein